MAHDARSCHIFLSLLLVYSLILPLFAPLTVMRAEVEPTFASNKTAPPQSAAARPVKKKIGYRDGEVLVRFREEATEEEKDTLIEAKGARRARVLRGDSGVLILKLQAGQQPEALAAEFRESAIVEMAEPNYLISADETLPNDPRFNEQWALTGTVREEQAALKGINALPAWQGTTGAPSTIIAIIDSGVDFSHPDLRGNQWSNQREGNNKRDDDRNGFVDDLHGWDWVARGNAVQDDSGHGTKIAGIIAASGNNAAGITGIMWQASLMSLRVLDSKGVGDVASAVEAIDYAATQGASVINCSWGTDENSSILRDALERSASRNILVVASAGNDNRDIEQSPYYPASYSLSNVLVVASTDNTENLASWSNIGAAHVQVAAPGDNILTTSRDSGYEAMTGTSASAALASGVAGLVKTERPFLSAERTREMIVTGARPVASLKDKVSSGSVIDAAGAMLKVNALPPNEGKDNRGDNSGDNRIGNNNPGNPGSGNVSPTLAQDNANRTKGAPGSNLPNLDVVRKQKPREPKAAPPIPSTMRAPEDTEAAPQRRAAARAVPELVAWYSEAPTVDSLLSHPRGGVSDSPFSLFGGLRQTTNKAAGSHASYAPYARMMSPPTPPNTFSAVADFSASQNPNGAWSYGYKTLSGSSFTALTSNANLFGAGADTWSLGSCCTFVTRNNTGSTYTYPNAPSVVQPADMLNLHPGSSGERPVVRWTAPASGTYTIEGRFQGIDSVGPTTTDVAILHNSTTVFTGAINSYGGQATFSVTRTLNAGDTIDFQVGYGSNNNNGYDSTGLAATITQSNRVNVALALNGATATSSSNYGALYTASNAIDGEHKGLNYFNGGVWHSSAQTFPQWIQIDFSGSKTIDEIDVYSVQDNYQNPSEPTDTMTFSLYGLTAFDVQYWNGSAWVTVPGGSVTGNNLVRRKFTFSPITTAKIRVVINGTPDGWTRMPEVEAWEATSGSSDPTGSNFSVARTNPFNRTGADGVDLLSRNYNWSLPIVGLKGRAGLDLSLALSYNSLVWTKSGSYIKYDADHGFPGPGFRLGFPVIQSKYLNAQGVNSYLMLTSSGARTELRQLGTSNVYESADSSYLQLTESGSNLYVLTKDGTRLWYQPFGGDYQCVQIRDRNGNYISASYNSLGHITSVTDTVGRVITFNYDTYQNLNSITQSWRRDSQNGAVNETHTWATFGWSNLTMQTSFSGLTLSGVQNGQTIPVLTQVSLPDGSRYNFEYTSWGQVATIRNYAADNTQLNYVTYNLDTGAGQIDCPRFTEKRVYARDWNNNAEAVTTFSAFNPTSGMADMTVPDGTPTGILSREYFYTSGWQNGLTYQNEVWWGGARRKWTTTSWTQDNTGANYQLNPRPYDISIYDEAGNRRRTTIDYTSYGLPSTVREYAADGTTVLRRNETQYRFDAEFINRHILGVVWMELLYQGESTLQSKINYHHDWDYGAPSVYSNGQTPSTGFDAAGYSSPFFGRANVTGVYRYNVNAPDDSNQAVLVKRIGYNLAGEPFFTMDALDHRVSISYADSYSDENNSRNTLAYPTTITDGNNYSSTVQYNYDMGVPVRTQDPKGAIQTIAYDGAGRTEKAINQTNGAYTRRVYINSTLVQQFTTIQSGAGEAYSFTVYDGAGGIRATGGGLPNSSGGYRAQYLIPDIMGRLYQKSNPTEINGSWSPTGDDTEWAWSYQQYDWKGRPTITTNVDGTTKQASYSGCGCAGGEVVTLSGETLSQGNRRQKIYHDVSGRVVKMEVLNWDQSVYSTVVNSYNARDQLTNIRQYAGAEGSGTYQDTVMTYDGFGRLSTRKVPAQTSPTSYSYYADDTIQTVTDARGAAATFSHNARHLVTNISYSAPSGIAGTSAVSYSYDEAGNRTAMSDGSGSTTYQYNTLSQLQSETRSFNGIAGSYTLSYGYNLAGQVTSITDPFGSTISYSFDQIGRVNNITGTAFGGVTQYATNMQYRAWGALKHLDYGNNPRTLDIYYNSRLQPTGVYIPYVMQKNYQYNPDGTLQYSQNLAVGNSPDDQDPGKFDRAYSYDHAGRVTQALSGPAARGLADTTTRPYKQFYSFDEFNHQSLRTGQVWNGPTGMFTNETTNYVNDRVTGWTYDADGRPLIYGYTYDAAGSQLTSATSDTNQTLAYDGDGQRVRIVTTTTGDDGFGNTVTETITRYEIRSSLLGDVIVEVDGSGQKARGFVYSGGSVLAVQKKAGSAEWVEWQHADASGASYRVTLSNGGVDTTQSSEADPRGRNSGTRSPYTFPSPHQNGEDMTYPGMMDAINGYCGIDGIPAPCSMVFQVARSGAGVRAHKNVTTMRFRNDAGQYKYALATWQVTGYGSGYVPVGATFDGRAWRLSFGHNEYGEIVGRGAIGIRDQVAASESSFSHSPGQQDKRTTCEKMADDAQRIAKANKYVVRDFNRAFGLWTYGSYFGTGPLGAFGNYGSSSGTTGTSLPDQPGGQAPYRGQDGFYESFKDSLDKTSNNGNPDQIHHFGFHFSAALAGWNKGGVFTLGASPTEVQMGTDIRSNNWGDVRLAEQSIKLGVYIRNNPNELTRIGQLIKDVICNGRKLPGE